MDDVKKREEEIRRQIHEVLDLVLDINELQMSQKEETGDHPTVFFDFSGHIGAISVRVYEDGWEKDKSSDISLDSSIFSDSWRNLPSIIRRLNDFANRGVPDGAD